MWLGREGRGWTSDKSELNGGSSSVVLDWSFSGSEIGNYNPVEGEEAASGIKFVGLLVDRRVEVGVSTGEAGLEGFFEGEEIGNGKVTTELVGSSKPEGVRGWKSSSGLERTVGQSSKGGKIECNAA